jgi:DNA-3-methyladenine glycosylase I
VSWYCDIAPGHPAHGPYHDTEYGFPASDEAVLFERLALEIMQAGLSWEITLKKRAGFFKAFDGFNVDKVARYGDKQVTRLLADAGIIRNRRKIEAIIENAKRIQALRQSHGGFSGWIEAHHPLSKEDWVKLCKKTFVFMGGEVVNEFLMSLGYLPGAHRPDCPVARRIAKLKPKPAWMRPAPK